MLKKKKMVLFFYIHLQPRKNTCAHRFFSLNKQNFINFLKFQKMTDLKTLKLTEVIKNKLKDDELKKIKGGTVEAVAGCGSHCFMNGVMFDRAAVKAFGEEQE